MKTSSSKLVISTVAVGLVALLGSALWYFVPARSQPPAVSGNDVAIVLGDFENLTNIDQLDDSLDLAFRVGLEQSDSFHLVAGRQLTEILRGMSLDPDTPVDRELGLKVCESRVLKPS